MKPSSSGASSTGSSALASATKAKLSLTASNGKVTSFSMGIEGIAAAMAELENQARPPR